MLKTLISIFTIKCPRCHEGDLFEGSAYNPKNIINMPNECPKCKQAFFLEPGFYYGAMYVTYGVSVLIGLIVFTIAWGIMGFQMNTFKRAGLIMSLVLILIFPYNLRLSRAIWLALFYKQKKIFYDEIVPIKDNKTDHENKQ